MVLSSFSEELKFGPAAESGCMRASDENEAESSEEDLKLELRKDFPHQCGHPVLLGLPAAEDGA